MARVHEWTNARKRGENTEEKMEEEMDGGKSYRARTIAIPTKFSALSCYGIVKLNDALNYKWKLTILVAKLCSRNRIETRERKWKYNIR